MQLKWWKLRQIDFKLLRINVNMQIVKIKKNSNSLQQKGARKIEFMRKVTHVAFQLNATFRLHSAPVYIPDKSNYVSYWILNSIRWILFYNVPKHNQTRFIPYNIFCIYGLNKASMIVHREISVLLPISHSDIGRVTVILRVIHLFDQGWLAILLRMYEKLRIKTKTKLYR